MPLRPPAGFISAFYDPLKNPNAPTIGTATGGDASASVAFTAPSNVGGSAISSYTAISTPGGVTASAASSPVTVTGLTNGTAYTFAVWATNTYGPSAFSAASNSTTPTAPFALVGGYYTNGSPVNNAIERVSLTTSGNSTDWGDLSVARGMCGAVASSTRCVFGAGNTNGYSGGTNYRTMDYFTFATQGNAVNFGSMLSSPFGTYGYSPSGCSNSTRGIFWEGTDSNGNGLNVIQYITIASTGDATDFGDSLFESWSGSSSALASPTRGVYKYGLTNNIIQYITIATTGNAIDFGDLTQNRRFCAGSSSSTRGLFSGGDNVSTYYNTIDYITIASTGNATDFGDLTVAGSQLTASSSEITSLMMGGENRGNVIDKVTIATTGNAVDWGDLANGGSRVRGGSSSNVHGGLQ